MIRTAAAVLLAAASLTLTASPVMAAPGAEKDLCKSGGYAGYVDPATGAPFGNQGQCVSFVNKGGALTPVVVTPPPVDVPGLEPLTAKVLQIEGREAEGVDYWYRLDVIGATPGERVEFLVTFSNGRAPMGLGFEADDAGAWSFSPIDNRCLDYGTLVVTDVATDRTTTVLIDPSTVPACQRPVDEPPVDSPPAEVELGTLQFGYVWEGGPNSFSYALGLTGFQANATFDLVVFTPENLVGGPGYLGSWAVVTDANGDAVIGMDSGSSIGDIWGACNPINGPLTATVYPVTNGVADTDHRVTITAPASFCDGDGILHGGWLPL
jgi:hypothetical protein